MSNPSSPERVERVKVIGHDHLGRLTEVVKEVLGDDSNPVETVRTIYQYPATRADAPPRVNPDLKGPDSLWALVRKAVVAQGTHTGTDVASVIAFLDDAKVRLQIAADNEVILGLPPALIAPEPNS